MFWDALKFSLKKWRNFLKGNGSIFISVKYIKCMPEFIFFSFFLCFNAKCKKLTILQSSTVINIKLFKSLSGNYFPSFIAIYFCIPFNQLFKGKNSISICIKKSKYLLQFLFLFICWKMIIYQINNCHSKVVAYVKLF